MYLYTSLQEEVGQRMHTIPLQITDETTYLQLRTGHFHEEDQCLPGAYKVPVPPRTPQQPG